MIATRQQPCQNHLPGSTTLQGPHTKSSKTTQLAKAQRPTTTTTTTQSPHVETLETNQPAQNQSPNKPTLNPPTTTPKTNKPTLITITLLPDPTPAYRLALSAWRTLYSTHSTTPHPSPSTFAQTYSPPHGRLLTASTPTHPLAGLVAYRAYNDRFAHHAPLRFAPGAKVVEVVRLFVREECRGQGVGRALVRELVEVTRRDGVAVMYLHTHPFLPGAQALWEREGWEVLVREERGPWWTVHMGREV